MHSTQDMCPVNAQVLEPMCLQRKVQQTFTTSEGEMMFQAYHGEMD